MTTETHFELTRIRTNIVNQFILKTKPKFQFKQENSKIAFSPKATAHEFWGFLLQ